MDRRAFLERTTVLVTALGVTGCVGTSPSSNRTEVGSETATERRPDGTATGSETVRTATTTPANPTATGTGPQTRRTDRTTRLVDPTTTPTAPVRKRTESVSAAFVVTDVRGRGSPDEETATARFESAQNRIVVTGTIHVDECGQLAFQSIRETGDGTVVLVVGPDEYRTPDGTSVVCEHYSGEYRITLTVDGDLPERVRVVHRQEEGDTFTLTP